MKTSLKATLALAGLVLAGVMVPRLARATDQQACRTWYIATLMPGEGEVYYCHYTCCVTKGSCCYDSVDTN